MLTTVRCCPSPSAVGAELKLGQKTHRKMVPKQVGSQGEHLVVSGPATRGRCTTSQLVLSSLFVPMVRVESNAPKCLLGHKLGAEMSTDLRPSECK